MRIQYIWLIVNSSPKMPFKKLNKLFSLSWRIFVAFFFKPLLAVFNCSLFWAKESNFSPRSKMLVRLSRTPCATYSSSISILFSFFADSISLFFSSSSSGVSFLFESYYGLNSAMPSFNFMVRLWVRDPRSSLSSWSSNAIFVWKFVNKVAISWSDAPDPFYTTETKTYVL